jgi:hypothetical protein
LIAWAGAQRTPVEMEALARIDESAWDPKALEDWDKARLEGLIDRLPRKT